MAHATLLSWGVDGYYRRDLKEGILQGENAVKADVKALLDDIINTTITSKKPLNQDTILAILQGKRTIAMGKNNGDGKMSNTDNAILYKAAQNILLQIKPYEQYLLSTDKDTKNLVKDTK